MRPKKNLTFSCEPRKTGVRTMFRALFFVPKVSQKPKSGRPTGRGDSCEAARFGRQTALPALRRAGRKPHAARGSSAGRTSGRLEAGTAGPGACGEALRATTKTGVTDHRLAAVARRRPCASPRLRRAAQGLRRSPFGRSVPPDTKAAFAAHESARFAGFTKGLSTRAWCIVPGAWCVSFARKALP